MKPLHENFSFLINLLIINIIYLEQNYINNEIIICRFCMLKPSPQESTRYISILEQVTKDIFSVDISRELRDLHKKSSSFISAGFK